MYDTIWKVSVLAMLVYIIYSLYLIKKDIYTKIEKQESKNIVFKDFNSIDYENDIFTEDSLSDNNYSITEKRELEELSNDVSEISESSIIINIDNNDLSDENLKNKNLKELKIIAKNLNIPIHNKKKNDIITEILFNK